MYLFNYILLFFIFLIILAVFNPEYLNNLQTTKSLTTFINSLNKIFIKNILITWQILLVLLFKNLFFFFKEKNLEKLEKEISVIYSNKILELFLGSILLLIISRYLNAIFINYSLEKIILIVYICAKIFFETIKIEKAKLPFE